MYLPLLLLEVVVALVEVVVVLLLVLLVVLLVVLLLVVAVAVVVAVVEACKFIVIEFRSARSEAAVTATAKLEQAVSYQA